MAANNELLVFVVGDRRIAVPASTVRELLRAVAITPLPGAPPGVEGVIDVRGTLMPVIDLAERFGATRRPICASDHLLICDVTVGPLAVRADRVIEMRTEGTDLVPPGAEADGLVRSLMRTSDGVVVICELARFLAERDIAALAAALQRFGDA